MTPTAAAAVAAALTNGIRPSAAEGPRRKSCVAPPTKSVWLWCARADVLSVARARDCCSPRRHRVVGVSRVLSTVEQAAHASELIFLSPPPAAAAAAAAVEGSAGI
jgi:hypothetical protein